MFVFALTLLLLCVSFYRTHLFLIKAILGRFEMKKKKTKYFRGTWTEKETAEQKRSRSFQQRATDFIMSNLCKRLLADCSSWQKNKKCQYQNELMCFVRGRSKIKLTQMESSQIDGEQNRIEITKQMSFLL